MKKCLKIATLCFTVILSMSFLVACGIPNSEKTRKNLEKDGYTFSKTIETAVTVGLEYLKIETESVVCATKIEDGEIDSVLLVYCKSKAQAKEAEEEVLNVLKKNFTADNDEVQSGRDGKIIYFGTQDAIDDCK